MKLIKSICGFMKDSTANLDSEGGNTNEIKFSENSKGKSREFEEQMPPRDGMSAESAKFLIGKYTNNKSLKIYGIKNKGRYFTAKVLDPKGNVVNELLVDKLNGHVKFIR